MIAHKPLAVALLFIFALAGCAGEGEGPVPAPKEIEVAGDTARLGGFADVTANAEGHARVVVRQPEPEHAAWLLKRGFRFRTFLVDTAAVPPDTTALQPDSLRFERNLAPGTLIYTRTSNLSDTSSAVTE